MALDYTYIVFPNKVNPSPEDVSYTLNCPSFLHRDVDIDNLHYKKSNSVVIKRNIVMPDCSNTLDFSGCCKIATTISNDIYDNLCINPDQSTGLIMNDANDICYNICHSTAIQEKKDLFQYYNKSGNTTNFLKYLLMTIVAILIVTLLALPYEFFLRYGNSIHCIYYKVSDKCKNMGSKKSDTNDKLSIIEYCFPDNLDNWPYEKCKNTSNSSTTMVGGSEKKGSFNSNYIEYHENGSKCITVDFDDDPEELNSRPFPYNVGEYAHTKVKYEFVAMILRGFSFYFLFTILHIRIILNWLLSKCSKIYQKNLEKYPILSTIVLTLSILITPPILFGGLITIISVVFLLAPYVITAYDIGASINKVVKKKNAYDSNETNPSKLEIPDYYTIYSLKMFYPALKYLFNDTNNNGDSNYNERMESYFKNNNRIFAVACALIITAISTAIHISYSENNDNLMHSSGGKGVNINEWTAIVISQILVFAIFSIIFVIINEYYYRPLNPTTQSVKLKYAKKVIFFLKNIISNIILFVPWCISMVATFTFGMIGCSLAGVYAIFKLIFDFYYITYSNSIEFLDLFKNHSKLLTFLLLISVVTSSRIAGYGTTVSGMLGGLLLLYVLYELYNFSK